MSDANEKQVPLRQIHIHLQDNSNLTCSRICLQPALPGNGTFSTKLDLKTAFQVIREAVPLGLDTVRLSGGSTLFYPDLDPLLDKLEALELVVEIETNGVGLTPQRVNRLSRLPQCTVRIALDGADAATHDFYSQPGSFDYTTRAIRLLSSAGVSVQPVFTARRRNASQIAAVVRLVEVLGGSSLRFQIPHSGINNLAKHNGNGNHHVNNPLVKKVHNFPILDELKVEELIALGWKIEREMAFATQIRLIFDQPPAFRGLHPKSKLETLERCSILNRLSITRHGEYALCGVSQALGGLVLGKINEAPLADIWRNHPTLNLLREGLPNRLQGVCERCMMKTTCLGGCPVDNYARTGSFWSPGWFCESADRVGLFPAGRLIENYW